MKLKIPEPQSQIPNRLVFLELQNLYYFAHITLAEFQIFGFQGNSADDRVSAAAVFFADLGDVMSSRARRPRIRADRDLRAEAAARQ